MGLLDNIFNQIMPGPSKNPYGGLLSNDQYQEYRRQKLMQGVGRMGDFFMRAAGGNFSGGQGGQGQDGLLDIIKMQKYQREQQGQQRQDYARETLQRGSFPAGPDPRTGIDWAAPRQRTSAVTPTMGQTITPATGLLEREKKGLLGVGYPEIAGKAQAAEIYPKPQQPPAGFERTTAGLGPISGGPADVGYLGRKAAATRAPTERQSKIKELKARGLSQSQAEDIASGRVRISTNPVDGSISLVNVVSGAINRPSGQPTLPKKTRQEMASRRQSIGMLLDKMPQLQKSIEKGVGFVPAVKEFGGKVFGQFATGSVDVPYIGEVGLGEKAVDSDVVRARNDLRIFREDVIAAFRKSGKVPVQEQSRILEFVDKLGVINSVPDAKLAFQQLGEELRRIDRLYGVQLGGQSQTGERTRVQTDEDYNALPSGAEFVAPDGTIRRKP